MLAVLALYFPPWFQVQKVVPVQDSRSKRVRKRRSFIEKQKSTFCFCFFNIISGIANKKTVLSFLDNKNYRGRIIKKKQIIYLVFSNDRHNG